MATTLETLRAMRADLTALIKKLTTTTKMSYNQLITTRRVKGKTQTTTEDLSYDDPRFGYDGDQTQ